MKASKILVIGFLSLTGFGFVLAQPKSLDQNPTMTTEAGATIAAQGTKAGAVACNGCHGPKGEGMVTSGSPRIAGEPTYYMVKQLKDYASGTRDNAVMGPIAKALTDSEKESVSAYFSSLPIPPLKPAKKASTVDLKRGQILAKTGDIKLLLQACNNCHGPEGMGVAPAMPGLASQHSGYLAQQIAAWKDGKRKNSPDQMAEIAKRLTDKDIQALGAYFESVQLGSAKKTDFYIPR